jgi:hypothetical protein
MLHFGGHLQSVERCSFLVVWNESHSALLCVLVVVVVVVVFIAAVNVVLLLLSHCHSLGGHEVLHDFFPFSWALADPNSHAKLLALHLNGVAWWCLVAFKLFNDEFFVKI